MNTFRNNYDTLEQLIFEGGLRIKAVHFHPDIDIMLIVLNNKKVLQRPISTSSRLQEASIEQLNNYQLISNGVGIHWPELDEDLSLKGFLKEELTKVAQIV